MTRAELLSRWTERRETYARVAATVKAERLIGEFLKDIASLAVVDERRVLTLKAASGECGYSVEHLGRLVRQGSIRNAGRRCAPRIYADELPQRGSFARTRALSCVGARCCAPVRTTPSLDVAIPRSRDIYKPPVMLAGSRRSNYDILA